MACVIKYKGQSIPEEQFLQYLNKQIAINNLFNENETLANAVYEALGFKSKPDVILPIGTSGSGKSTFIKSLPQENLVIIEPDAMRVEFTGDMNNKSKDKEIYEEAAKRAVQAIKQGKQVVFDTTNLTKDKRLPFIEAIKKAIPNANIQYKLMELNPELANQVYSALGYNQIITPNDKIVFGHPGIGKTFAKKSNDFIDVDEDYKEEHTMQKILRANAKNSGKKEDLKEWEDYVTSWWSKVKSDAKKSGKRIFVSNLPILRMFPEDFDKILNLSKEKFIERAKQRDDYVQGETEDWKSSLDIEISKIDKSKVFNTDKYLSDLLVTPQQKATAQQLYSQYLDSLSKPNTNPILQDNQQEQIKKFKELQERLNNKEFLEGAKNAYESTPELQQFGTQEEYNDYIARVSLGIIKNPSSGEYNYESQVKDIVYHGADEKIDNFTLDKKKNKKEKGLFFFKKRKSAQLWRDASFEEDNTKQGDLISALINLNTPETIDFENKSAWDMAKYSNENVKGDGLIATNVDEFYAGRDTQYVIFEPEQIHILGSKQDIEGFKKFVGNKEVYQGTNDGVNNREFNYYTLNEQEALNYGKNVTKYSINTKDYLKANSTDYLDLVNQDYKLTGQRFDVLDNSPEGLKKQKQFFKFVKSKGFKGIDFTNFSDSQYLVSFNNNTENSLPLQSTINNLVEQGVIEKNCKSRSN